ncbi:DddA-like double-stranded DNA deaminase toxin [Phytomonospora sp. NPDC050363]|uniref:DddA-like double-stranded DNA deaminase toxin n=1 Tax=Phytomonospora sp. NPDC050363 TaxID=3155642 RepID=UPI003402420E
MIASLEAVLRLVEDGRRLTRAAAEKFGDTHGTLSAAFGNTSNSSASAALDRIGQAAEQIDEADGDAAAALHDIGDYIEIVKGSSSAGSASASVSGKAGARRGFDPAPHLRDMPPFPGTDNKTHGRAIGKSGKVESVVSGELDPTTRELDPRYVEGVKLARRLGLVPPKGKLTAAGDVELKWAWQMRQDSVTKSQVTINNPKGPCLGDLSCDTLLPTWLDQNSELTVHWRDKQGRDRSKTYVGEPDEH